MFPRHGSRLGASAFAPLAQSFGGQASARSNVVSESERRGALPFRRPADPKGTPDYLPRRIDRVVFRPRRLPPSLKLRRDMPGENVTNNPAPLERGKPLPVRCTQAGRRSSTSSLSFTPFPDSCHCTCRASSCQPRTRAHFVSRAVATLSAGAQRPSRSARPVRIRPEPSKTTVPGRPAEKRPSRIAYKARSRVGEGGKTRETGPPSIDP